MTRRFLLVLAVFLGFSTAGAGQYLKHFRKGRQLYRQKQYHAALQEFDKALSKEQKPGAMYFKARTLIGLKRYLEAEALLRKVSTIKTIPALVRREIPILLRTIRIELSTLSVTLTIRTPGVDAAWVRVDGTFVGKTPITLTRRPGKVRVKVTMPGYTPHERSYTVFSFRKTTLDIILKVAPVRLRIFVRRGLKATVTLDGKKLGTAPVIVRRMPGRYRLKVEMKDHRTHEETLVVEIGEVDDRTVTLKKTIPPISDLRLWSYICFGVGGGSLVGAAVLNAIGLQTRKKAANPDLLHVQAKRELDRSNRQLIGAYVMYGLSAAALIAATTLLIKDLNRPKPDDEDAQGPRFQLVPHRRGVAIWVQF